MKLLIILKKQDADGLGGEILSSFGMKRSVLDPGVFGLITPTHDTVQIGHGDTSWSQPEATVQLLLEMLMDHDIRPMRVLRSDNSTAGLTPIHAMAGGAAGVETSAAFDVQKEQRLLLHRLKSLEKRLQDANLRMVLSNFADQAAGNALHKKGERAPYPRKVYTKLDQRFKKTFGRLPVAPEYGYFNDVFEAYFDYHLRLSDSAATPVHASAKSPKSRVREIGKKAKKNATKR